MNLKRLLVASAIATAAMMVAMMLHGAPLKIAGVTPHGIIDMELARTPMRAMEIYNTWFPVLTKRAIANTYLDFLFIFSYGCLLYCLCKTASGWYNAAWRVLGRRLSVCMVLAAFCDVVENIQMFKMLHGRMGSELVASAYMFATIKFVLAALGILYFLISLVGLALRVKPLPKQQP